jgi:hypothetical protein
MGYNIEEKDCPHLFKEEYMETFLKDIPETYLRGYLNVHDISFKEESIMVETQPETSLSNYNFSAQGFILNETWQNTSNIQARITKITKERITCECIIDKGNLIFETRSFPTMLFDHMPKKDINYPVVISLKTKPGSSRIDIRDGKNIVDLSVFDLEEGWKELINSGLDQPLSLNNDSSNI